MRLVSTVLFVLLVGCGGSHEPDLSLAQDVIRVIGKIESPAALDGRINELLKHPESYAMLVSGYIGAPDDFDLIATLGNVNHAWRRYIEAESFYTCAKATSGLEAHIEITNAVLAGKPERLKAIKGSPLIDREVLRVLSDRNSSTLASAVNELLEAAKTADIRATLIYADMIAALAVNTESVDSQTAQLVEEAVFVPAWLELLEGASFAQFADSVRSGKQSYRQTVILESVASIVSHASDFWEGRDRDRLQDDWTARRDELLSLLVVEKIIPDPWAKHLMQNQAVQATSAKAAEPDL